MKALLLLGEAGSRNFIKTDISRLGDDGNGKYLIFGPGAHRIRSPFYNIGEHDVSIMTPVIMHGTWTIVTVSERATALIVYCALVIFSFIDLFTL